MSFISYSQNFEDVLLWRALGHLERGTYLDIGAQDPVHDSVSLAFYNAGWRGTHVEPTPYYAERLREARPDETVIQAAVSSCAGPIEFYEFAETGLSTGCSAIAERHVEHGFAHRPVLVPTVRLSNLLGQTGEVQWLKIDVEGMEADVLLSWDDCPIRPWVLVIEATAPLSQEQTHHEWEQLVTDRGYGEIHFDGLSRFFVDSAHRELAEQLRPSVNVFDRFSITERHFTATLLLERAAQERAEAQERNLALAEQARTAEHHLAIVEQERAAANAEQAHLRQALQDAHEAAAAAESKIDILAAERLAALQALAQQARTAEHHLAAVEQERAAANAEHADLRQALQDAHEAAVAAESKVDMVAAERLAALQALAAAETDHRHSVERSAATLERAHAELLDVTRARLADLREHQRLASEAQQDLRNAEARCEAAEFAQAELKGEKLRWEKQEQATLIELGIIRERLEEQKRAFAGERATLEGQVARGQQVEEHVAELNTMASSLQQQLSEAGEVIAKALAQPAGRWQQLGRALGFARDDAALNALRSWLSSRQSPTESHRDDAMNFAPPTEARNPRLRANSLAELLSWSDADFVRCAYVTVLGREPDREGEYHYTNQLREGHSKREVLWTLRRSAEGRNHDPGIGGFDRALRKAARQRSKLLGLFAIAGRIEGDRPQDRRHRAQLNEMVLLRLAHVERNRTFGAILEQFHESRSRSDVALESGEETTVNPEPVSNDKLMLPSEVLARLSHAERVVAELLT